MVAPKLGSTMNPCIALSMAVRTTWRNYSSCVIPSRISNSLIGISLMATRIFGLTHEKKHSCIESNKELVKNLDFLVHENCIVSAPVKRRGLQRSLVAKTQCQSEFKKL